MTEQEKREKIIKGLQEAAAYFRSSFDAMYGTVACEMFRNWTDAIEQAIALLKVQEAVEPHYTNLEYIVNGMPYAVHHPECPRCIENGLTLWDAEIERGAAYCKRCGQAVKWE